MQEQKAHLKNKTKQLWCSQDLTAQTEEMPEGREKMPAIANTLVLPGGTPDRCKLGPPSPAKREENLTHLIEQTLGVLTLFIAKMKRLCYLHGQISKCVSLCEPTEEVYMKHRSIGGPWMAFKESPREGLSPELRP